MLSLEELLSRARDKWRLSGLTDEYAAKLGFTVVAGGNELRRGGLRIPYYDLNGQPTGFYRIRFLEDLPGFLLEKPQRYFQPPGCSCECYLVPSVQWEGVARDVNMAVVITEGELKAACACSHGILCIGLGGVDMWRAQAQGFELLPSLRKFAWKGRDVVIVYDSDVAVNLNVLRAQRQLAEMLLAEGAHPRIASLPPKDGKKQGLDDFVVARGPQALRDVLEAATATSEGHGLWELNGEVAYVHDPGVVVNRKTGQIYAPHAFTGHLFAHRSYFEERAGKDGAVRLVRKPLAPRWLTWEARFEVARMTYRPGEPAISWDTDGCPEINGWKGWGCAPVEGDIAPWTWLLDRCFTGYLEERQWFERWCAYPLQHPGAKLYTAALVWSPSHGIGKTLIGLCLLAIYGQNGKSIGQQDLGGDFNSWAKYRQFLLGDEITGNDSRAYADRIKSLITAHVVTINEKYVAQFDVPNVAQFFFTSNHQDAFFLEDDDRRFFVHKFSGGKGTDAEYRKVDAWVRSSEGPAALFWHLLHLDLGGFNPKAAALATSAKREMVQAARSDLGAWIARLKEDPEGEMPGVVFAEAEELLHVYDPMSRNRVTAQGMARALASKDFVRYEKFVRLDGRSRHLWILRDAARWRNAAESEVEAQWVEQVKQRKF